jgi:hypothetical protein
MTHRVMTTLLKIFQEASAKGECHSESTTTFCDRDAAYIKGTREGIIFDMTQKGLITSSFESITGITREGAEAFDALQGILAIDKDGMMSEALVGMFIPAIKK